MFSAISLLITALVASAPPLEPLPTLRSSERVSVTEIASDEQPTILIVVAAQRLRLTKAWELAIRESIGDVQIIRIAELKADAEIEAVRRKLGRRIPAEIDLLLDAGGNWAQQLELDVNEPSLLLLRSDRSVHLLARGRHSPERLDKLLSALSADDAGREE